MAMNPSNPPQSPQPLTPDSLASQLFDAAFMQNKMTDPRAAAQQVIGFLTEALFYAVTSAKHDVIVFLAESIIFVASTSSPDEASRKELLKKIGETIINAPPLSTPAKPAPASPKP